MVFIRKGPVTLPSHHSWKKHQSGHSKSADSLDTSAGPVKLVCVTQSSSLTLTLQRETFWLFEGSGQNQVKGDRYGSRVHYVNESLLNDACVCVSSASWSLSGPHVSGRLQLHSPDVSRAPPRCCRDPRYLFTCSPSCAGQYSICDDSIAVYRSCCLRTAQL